MPTSLNKFFNVLHEDDDILIVIKPRGLPCVGLASKNDTHHLVHYVSTMRPALKLIHSYQQHECGLLHRLDNDTEGLVLFAKNQISFDNLSEQARSGGFQKTYLAHCSFNDEPSLSPSNFSLLEWQKRMCSKLFGSYHFQCYFVKAEAKKSRVRAIQHYSRHASKAYETDFIFYEKSHYIEAICTLKLGFRHQVRASLTALGLPIIGDPFYPQVSTKNHNFAFWSIGLQFCHPSLKHGICYFYHPYFSTENDQCG